jgi:hypothetical protein
VKWGVENVLSGISSTRSHIGNQLGEIFVNILKREA